MAERITGIDERDGRPLGPASRLVVAHEDVARVEVGVHQAIRQQHL